MFRAGCFVFWCERVRCDLDDGEGLAVATCARASWCALRPWVCVLDAGEGLTVATCDRARWYAATVGVRPRCAGRVPFRPGVAVRLRYKTNCGEAASIESPSLFASAAVSLLLCGSPRPFLYFVGYVSQVSGAPF